MPSNVFFTADLHLGHERIIQYCNRPFSSAEEMEEVMLQNFNSVVKRGDELYILGDLAWSTYDLDRFFGKLNSKQIHIIWGNHDDPKRTRHPSFVSYRDLYGKAFGPAGSDYIVLCHYSMQSWNRRGHGAYHLFGHSHGMLPGIGRSLDVGVDTNNFYPYPLEEIKERMNKIPYKVYE